MNIRNVEELVFYDKNLWKLLPELQHFYNHWVLAQQTSALRSLGKRAIIEFLQTLTPDHLKIMSEYFKQVITLDKFEFNSVKNLDFDVKNAEKELSKIVGLDNYATFRKGDRLYISFWR